jgi:hypothetical protein
MLALRFAGLLAVAVWFGGLLTLGAITAPAVFDGMAARQVAEPRAVAGAIVGEIIRRFHFVSYACGAVILATLAVRAVLGPRPRYFRTRMAIAAGMLAAALYSGLSLTSRIEQLRQEIAVAPSSLRDDDPRRQRFGRLHAQSNAVQLVPLMGSLVLLISELKD